ncbi:hypothetical protein FRB99_008651 [Tulasnella sp. 403]|nr:hypothetical protein FRB99_008651 [Tulasnella sp. 403]
MSQAIRSGTTGGPVPPVVQVLPRAEPLHDTAPPRCQLSFLIDILVYLLHSMPLAPLTNAIETLLCISPGRNEDHNEAGDHPPPPHRPTQPIELLPLPPPAYSTRYSPPPAPPYEEQEEFGPASGVL